MDPVENTTRKQLLEKLLKDPSKKLLSKSKYGDETYYDFQDWIKDLPEERRRGLIHFRVYRSGEIHMYRRKEKHQKFLCVGGPSAGRRSTEDDAPEYVVFNCANSDRSRRDKKLPRVILVHRSAWTATRKSR